MRAFRVLALAVVTVFSGVASAQTAPAPFPPPPGGSWTPEPARTLRLYGAPGRGVTFASSDDFFSVTMRGRLQVRESVVAPNHGTNGASGITNEVNLRTLRLIFSGNVFSPSLGYVVQLALAPQDYESGLPSPIFDGWVGYSRLRDLNLRVGQFFVPFDRARTNAEWGIQFIDRPLIVAEATLDRDVGVELGSNNLAGLNLFGWRLGVFGGEGRNRGPTEDGFLYVARFQCNPFGTFDDTVEGDLERLPRARLSLGVAGAYNHNTHRQRSTTGTTLVLDGLNYHHAAVDLVFKWRGLYLLAEGLYRGPNTDRRQGVVMTRDTTEWSRTVYGYLAQVGFMVSRRIELVGRWEQSFAPASTDPALLAQLRTQGRQFGAGANVYLSGHGLEVQVDYHYLFGDVFGDGRHQARAQVQLSF